MDFACWINRPSKSLERKRCTPKHIDTILGFIIANADRFPFSPLLFDPYCEVTKKKTLVLWLDK